MLYHILAILTVAIWGTTFISTKVLLEQGLSPADIFLLRFSLAYAGMTLYFHRQWFCHNWRDELLMILAGMAGGSIYFLTENTALLYLQAGTVSFIVCLAPLLTTLIARLGKAGETISPRLWIGSTIALAGVGLVVSNHSMPGSAPFLGCILSFAAAFSWSIYQLIVKPLGKKYGTAMLTRKVFGYGLLTILPIWSSHITEGFVPRFLTLLEREVVWANLLYLGVLASFICFWLWNVIVKQIGSVVSSNYIYLNPLVTCIASYFLLGEDLTANKLIGGAAILFGIYLATGLSKVKKTKHKNTSKEVQNC